MDPLKAPADLWQQTRTGLTPLQEPDIDSRAQQSLDGSSVVRPYGVAANGAADLNHDADETNPIVPARSP